MELRETLDDVFSAMIIIMKKSHVKAFRTVVDTFMHTIAIPLRSFVHLSSKVHIANVKSVLKEVLDALNQLVLGERTLKHAQREREITHPRVGPRHEEAARLHWVQQARTPR